MHAIHVHVLEAGSGVHGLHAVSPPCVHVVAYVHQLGLADVSMTAELSYIQLKAANEARVSVSASREIMLEPSCLPSSGAAVACLAVTS